jgi:hypothetical protein
MERRIDPRVNDGQFFLRLMTVEDRVGIARNQELVCVPL